MSGPNNWAPPENIGDYLGHREKDLGSQQRRPAGTAQVANFLGSGLARHSVIIHNYNDPRATTNGFFVADVGAAEGPWDRNEGPAFGYVVTDSTYTGRQHFTSASGRSWVRTFTRLPLSPEDVQWGGWYSPDDSSAIMASWSATETVTTPNVSTPLAIPGYATVGDPGAFTPLYGDGGRVTGFRVNRRGAYTLSFTVVNPDITYWDGAVTYPFLDGVQSTSITLTSSQHYTSFSHTFVVMTTGGSPAPIHVYVWSPIARRFTMNNFHLVRVGHV